MGSRSADLSWTASSDDVGVTGYKVFRDGNVVGTPSSTSYSDGGLTPSTPYTYTVVAVDAAGNPSAPSDPLAVTTLAAASLSLDKAVSTHQGSAATTISAPALSTAGPGELLVAFISSDGPNRSAGQSITGVSGGGLSWKLRQRTNTQAGTAEIWQAVAPTTLSNVVVTATRASGSYQGAITVAAFVGADTATLGAVGSGNGANGAPSATLTTTRAGSWVWGVGVDWDKAIVRTLGSGQSLVDQFLSPSGDTYWTQRQTAVTPAGGTAVTVNDSAPTSDRWDMSLMEILAG
jgi:hypothetical protein